MQNSGQGKGNPVKRRLKIGLITYTCFLYQRGKGSALPGKEEVSVVLAWLFLCILPVGLQRTTFLQKTLLQLKFYFRDSDRNDLRTK